MSSDGGTYLLNEKKIRKTLPDKFYSLLWEAELDEQALLLPSGPWLSSVPEEDR